MVTQELNGLEAGGVRETFWTDRKGRVIADLALAETGERMFASVERQSAPAAADSLNEFLFADDVEIRDAGDEWHHLAIHGPRTLELLSEASGTTAHLHEQDVATLTIAGVECVVTPRNLTGGPGVDIIALRETVNEVWNRLLESGGAMGERPGRVRPVGWFALNCARIEAGVPLFNVDFSHANLPAETGLLEERVSFTKGCYPGQEVVSRMFHRGRPKQVITGFDLAGEGMPIAGAAVFKADDAGDAPTDQEIGTVTSSTPSPLRSLAAIGLAMVRGREAAPGTTVFIEADGERMAARLCALDQMPAAAAKAATSS